MKKVLDMDIKLEHHKHELSAWSRTLDYHQQENTYLKNLLVEILKNTSQGLPDKMEYYQNRLINNDTLLALIRHDIREYGKALERLEAINSANFLNSSKKLRTNMEKMEKELSSQKYDLNNYFEKFL